MKCPTCGAWTLVKDTRKQEDNTKIRKYECGNLHKFKTVEKVVSEASIRKKPKAPKAGGKS